MGKQRGGPRSVLRAKAGKVKPSKPSGLVVVSQPSLGNAAGSAKPTDAVAALATINKANPNPRYASVFKTGNSILLVGEGDFSFARALYAVLGGGGIVATSLDTKREVASKYPGSSAILDVLDRSGVIIKHGVDCTKLEDAEISAWLDAVWPGGFDRVVFNFPHVGGATQADIAANQAILKEFLSCAPSVLRPGGRIVVSLRKTPFYDAWELPKLAMECGLQTVATLPFDVSDFPGYNPVRTNPAFREAPGIDNAFLHVFGVSESATRKPAPARSSKPPKLPRAVSADAQPSVVPKSPGKPGAPKPSPPVAVFQGTYCTVCKEELGSLARVPIHENTPWHARKVEKARRSGGASTQVMGGGGTSDTKKRPETVAVKSNSAPSKKAKRGDEFAD